MRKTPRKNPRTGKPRIRITEKSFREILSRTSTGREFLKHYLLGTIEEKKELGPKYKKKP